MSFEELDQYYEYLQEEKSEHTFRSYKYAINNFVDFFNIKNMSDLSAVQTGNVLKWRSSFINGKDEEEISKSKNSANSRMRPIKAFFNWLIDHEYCDKNPCQKIKPYKIAKVMRVYATTEERDKMINSCSYLQSELILSMAFYLGLRRDEISKIKIKDIHNDMILIHGKGSKERSLPLNSFLLNLIDRHLKNRRDDCEYLFVSSKNGFSNKFKDGEYHPISGEAIRQIVKHAAIKSNIDDKEKIDKIAPHTCRRSFAVYMAQESKANAFQISKSLGHEDIKTTQIYLSGAGAEIAKKEILSLREPVEA